jgi:hypothetical protein
MGRVAVAGSRGGVTAQGTIIETAPAVIGSRCSNQSLLVFARPKYVELLRVPDIACDKFAVAMR